MWKIYKRQWLDCGENDCIIYNTQISNLNKLDIYLYLDVFNWSTNTTINTSVYPFRFDFIYIKNIHLIFLHRHPKWYIKSLIEVLNKEYN